MKMCFYDNKIWIIYNDKAGILIYKDKVLKLDDIYGGLNLAFSYWISKGAQRLYV